MRRVPAANALGGSGLPALCNASAHRAAGRNVPGVWRLSDEASTMVRGVCTTAVRVSRNCSPAMRK